MGRRNNQNFVQIPHARFIELLSYKLEAAGIAVVVGEESYTSKASFLDWDSIPIYTPTTKEKAKFSGKRVKRSWYVTEDGLNIHADVNGAFNIGRKVIPTEFDCLKSIVQRDRGCKARASEAYNSSFQACPCPTWSCLKLRSCSNVSKPQIPPTTKRGGLIAKVHFNGPLLKPSRQKTDFRY